jgi:hypothetical protein
MGYFGHLYLVDMSTGEVGVTTATSVYGADIGATAYFSWGAGRRPTGMHEYAEGSVVTNAPLALLPGYPLIEGAEVEPAEDPGRMLVEASFDPPKVDDPVVFHFMLPPRFVPRRDLQPFEQPQEPSVFRWRDRVVATYPVVGRASFRFWIARIDDGESLDTYDLTKVFHPAPRQSWNVEAEFNVGLFKVKVS